MINQPTANQHHRVMTRAMAECAQRDLQFTPQRQQVFLLLYDLGRPVTAYELLDLFKAKYKPSAQPMTVYRTLDFLVDAGLIHRLDSRNQFVVCRHLTCEHEHGRVQFLICDRCGQVIEQSIPIAQWHQMEASVSALGFRLNSLPLELHGDCAACQAAAAS